MSAGTSNDQYTPPSAPLGDPSPLVGVSIDRAPPSVVLVLSKTLPWVTVLAVLLLAVSIGLPLFVSFKDIFKPESAATSRQIESGSFAVIYIPGAVYLWRYAASIRRLLRVQSVAALDEAMVNQKSFWKYMAILSLLLVAWISLPSIRGALR
jgi:hypothetical protein